MIEEQKNNTCFCKFSPKIEGKSINRIYMQSFVIDCWLSANTKQVWTTEKIIQIHTCV